MASTEPMTSIAPTESTAPAETTTEQEYGVESLLKNLDQQVIDAKKLFLQMQSGVRLIRKQVFVLQKLAQKAQKTKRKRAVSDSNRVSGFAAASVLSSELKEFMGVPMDTKKSRTEVTKWLCTYVQENQLQGTEDKRYIMFTSEKGKKLQQLLRCEKDSITYFELQGFLKKHISSKNNPMPDTSASVDTETASINVPADPVTVEAVAAPEPKRRVAIRPRPSAQTTA